MYKYKQLYQYQDEKPVAGAASRIIKCPGFEGTGTKGPIGVGPVRRPIDTWKIANLTPEK